MNKDKKDHNQELLRYAPTLLLNKTTCKEHYEDYANMSYVIETYMICTLGKGNIDDGGNTIVTSLPIQNGCTKEQAKVLGFEGVSCEEEEYEDGDETRRQLDGKDGLNQTYIDNMAGGFNESIDWKWLETGRRSGICQNDHGGPLITWSGAREILIGVASVFKVSDQYDCMGPYLFTSTLCTGLFLDCILTSAMSSSQNGTSKNRRDLCDRPSYEKGYETVERHIRWKDNPPVLEKWSYIDIALAKVESPYDFEDTTYERLCSYKPAIIPINYDPKYQTTDVDSMVMGFGHKSLWRQNDHGGPLVTWVGSREIIIGIASVFKINEENACIGPFLYTSTQCNSAFLDCVLNNPYWLDKPGDAKPVETNKTKTRGPAQNELQPETQEFERRIVTEQNYSNRQRFYELVGNTKNHLPILVVLYTESHGERRIIDGNEVSEDKSYVVYLVKAPFSNKIYDSWLCGGALVSKEFILTSAACVEDVDFLYAIAGYKKYVKDKFIEHDDCTKTMKKKVIYTCVPVGYEIRYERLDKWALIDIGVVKVESPYDFTDQSYKTICSYTPSVIPVSYEARYQEPGTDAIVFGWGHLLKWRKKSDNKNHNQAHLNYASVMIIDKEECKKHYSDYENMTEVIDKYMICTYGQGNIDDRGDPIEAGKAQYNGCNPKDKNYANDHGGPLVTWVGTHEILIGIASVFKVSEDSECELYAERDQEMKVTPQLNDIFLGYTIQLEYELNYHQVEKWSYIDIAIVKVESPFDFNDSKYETLCSYKPKVIGVNYEQRFQESGIDALVYGWGHLEVWRQNDHGGPLVTWVGANEVLIGVASVFKVTSTSKCTGPYLYTSTRCNGMFLHCILSSKRRRRSICDSPPIQRGYETVEKFISWKSHPAGPAQNEIDIDNQEKPENLKMKREFSKLVKFSDNQMIALRPQKPISNT
ncbi:unnamed protein product [Spodoptera exigua]|nr:unnamed protein product [Spodoptera exigua]